MPVTDDDGRVLDAEYRIEREGGSLALIFESASGQAGDRPARNRDYRHALAVLLTRLRGLDAVLQDALVDSAATRRLGIAEAERRLINSPVRLADEDDMEALRLRLTSAQVKIGRPPNAPNGGNSSKRIRLQLDVPGYGPDEADRLAARLATSATGPVPTFILTWNPDLGGWPPDEYEHAVLATARGESWKRLWILGLRFRGISAGNGVLLLRQHRDRGLVASGVFASGLEYDAHWEGSGRQTPYAQIEWDTVVDYEDRLKVEFLKAHVPEVAWDRIQDSGVAVPDAAVEKLNNIWSSHTDGLIFRSPEEPLPGETFPEGRNTRVEVNRYERDRRARKACLAHWGSSCVVCGLDFGDLYGSLGQGFIHVHHLLELSAMDPGYRVDPITDLRPVCPNCHAMLHRHRPALSIDELKRLLHRPGP
jgi:5-methylcytosine-specific restriction enzyme A